MRSLRFRTEIDPETGTGRDSDDPTACTVGFDPYQGFYHTGRHGRPSLALDLMEEFRPVIADSVVLSLINNGMLAECDFLSWRDACQLTDGGRKTFFETSEQRKATEVTHPIFGYKMSSGGTSAFRSTIAQAGFWQPRHGHGILRPEPARG
jgi:hypothetical protein